MRGAPTSPPDSANAPQWVVIILVMITLMLAGLVGVVIGATVNPVAGAIAAVGVATILLRFIPFHRPR